ncbi:MAG: hypothetical protein Q9192_003504 [Flavoplaca navasiana]
MATSPMYMASRHDLEDAFIAMQPCFKDKESEDNFKLREQAILKLRRITAGNAPNEFSDAFATGIKALVEGIIKTIVSLRTTVCKNGCDLVQDLAKARISNIDHVADFVLPPLIKLSANTKKITADKANETVTILITNISYNINLMRLMLTACEDKNTPPRLFATGWLKTLIHKHRDHKHVFEKGEGITIFEKCLKKTLADKDKSVRESVRPTYWAFIRLWPERAEPILSTLSESHRRPLLTESTESVPAPAKAATAAAAKSAAPRPKPSLKDTMAAKRQATKAEKTSAPEPMSRRSSTSGPSNPPPVPVTAAPRTLSSAPVRPSRVMRKATATSKPQSSDLSKSAIEVSKSTVEVPKTTPPKLSKSAIELSKATTPEPVKSPILTMLAQRPMSPQSSVERSQSPTPKSPILAMLSERSQSPQTAIRRPLSPGSSGALGLSYNRELPSPPLMTALRERSRSPASTGQSTGIASEVAIDTPEPSIVTPASSIVRSGPSSATPGPSSARPEQRNVTSSSLGPGNVPCSRKEGIARRAFQEFAAKPASESTSEEKWINIVRFQTALSSPRDEFRTSEVFVYDLRKEMHKLVQVIKADNWNLYVFRDIQNLMQRSWSLLDDDDRLFDELLFSLWRLIDSWNDELHIVRDTGNDHNTQVLLTLRMMLHYHKRSFSVYYPRTLCVLLSASRKQSDATHMQFALEDAVMAIIKDCDAGNREDSIDSVLDFLESYTDLQDRQPEYLGLFALTELMKSSDPERECRPRIQAERLGRLAARVVRSPYPEVRQRAVNFAMTYASFLADDAEFWRLASDVSNEQARLLTYYFTKQRTMQIFRLEEQMINDTYGTRALFPPITPSPTIR